MWGREWVLVPTGPGAPRLLPRGSITQLVDGAWLPDGKRIVFTAIEGGQGARGYVQDVDTGSMRPITPAGVHMPEKAASPDGKSVLVWLDGKWFLYPIDGGQPRPFSLLGADDDPRQWSADGRFLYVARRLGSAGCHRAARRHDGPPRAVEDARPVRSGRHRASRPVVITPDGRGHCYSYARRHHELYVVEGLK